MRVLDCRRSWSKSHLGARRVSEGLRAFVRRVRVGLPVAVFAHSSLAYASGFHSQRTPFKMLRLRTRAPMTSPMTTRRILLVITLLSLAGPAFAADAEPAAWPQFRGPSASGIATGNPPPIEFDVEKGKNVRWKTDVPGLGLSSP